MVYTLECTRFMQEVITPLIARWTGIRKQEIVRALVVISPMLSKTAYHPFLEAVQAVFDPPIASLWIKLEA
jgi:hypothetical protein